MLQAITRAEDLVSIQEVNILGDINIKGRGKRQNKCPIMVVDQYSNLPERPVRRE